MESLLIYLALPISSSMKGTSLSPTKDTRTETIQVRSFPATFKDIHTFMCPERIQKGDSLDANQLQVPKDLANQTVAQPRWGNAEPTALRQILLAFCL